MEKSIKQTLAESMKGNKYHFRCTCIVPINDDGVIKDYEIKNNEILFLVDFNGKIVKIGENHPNMYLTKIS